MSAMAECPRNTDYDAAQALLDLQSNSKSGKPHVRGKWSENEPENNMENAAKLIWNCFISSEVAAPSKRVTSGNNTNFTNSTPKPNVLKESSKFYKNRLSPRKMAKVDKTAKTKRSSDLSPIMTYPRKTSVNNQSYDSAISNENKSYYVVTRDVATQTDLPFFNPNIMIMETTIKNLCDKIKSLEAQIKTSHSKTNDQSRLEQSANSSATEDGDYSFDDDDQDPDYDVTTSDSHGRKHSTSSQLSKSSYVDNSNNIQMNRHVHPNRVLTNHNTNTKSLDMVAIGEGNATVPVRLLKHINWNSYSSATRKLLTAVFSRRILATHSLTGKPSPAFPNKPAKKKLDPVLVNDIVQTVVERCSVPESVVRTSITTKCADESKMLRTRQQNTKKRSSKKNRENAPPTSDTDSDNY